MRCEFNRGAIPAHVGEGHLAGVFGVFGGGEDALHEFQVPSAKLHLVRDQSFEEVAMFTLVPGHGAAVNGETPEEVEKMERFR